MVIEFKPTTEVGKLRSPKERREWWEASKHLQNDSLLCLTSAEGGTIFVCSVDQFEKKHPAAPGEPPQRGNLFDHASRAAGVFRMLDCNNQSLDRAVTLVKNGRRVVQSLVEFPGVLLQAFRPTLEVLQHIAQNNELPFSEFLAPSEDITGELHVPPPLYAQRNGFWFDLSCIMTDHTPLRLSPNEPFDMDSLTASSTLDDAQARALANALCRRLALIQGPPGTGKSYTGVALINVLLSNRIRVNLGPLIVVCCTNHALDQLLELLVKAGVVNIVHIGSRSKSALLEPSNLVAVSRQQDKTKAEKTNEYIHRKAIESHVCNLEELLNDLRRVESGKSIKTYLEFNFSEHRDTLFGLDEDGWKTVHYDLDRVIQRWLYAKFDSALHSPHKDRSVTELITSNINNTNSGERRRLHRLWIQEMTNTLCSYLRLAVKGYNEAREAFLQCRQELNLRCLQAANIIGVTTTGLAKNINLLRRLPSKVMICEETGEVLEAHTITALLPRIEHAILIGDHQQLRPQTQNYDLQSESHRGLKYALDVSLFERLVAPHDDGVPRIAFDTLKVQRRMHPSIATLVRDTLYPRLQDHPLVERHPEVLGIAKRLFWLDHQVPEVTQDRSNARSTSHSNDFEIETTAALVSHLVRQETFQINEIAVLTPYLGQLRQLRKRMSLSYEIMVGERDMDDLEREGLDDTGIRPSASHKTVLSKALRIATADNF